MCIFKKPIGTIVQPVIYPFYVEPNTPFRIIYEIQNTGHKGNVWASLSIGSDVANGSYWKEKLDANEIRTITYIFEEGIPMSSKITLETGR